MSGDEGKAPALGSFFTSKKKPGKATAKKASDETKAAPSEEIKQPEPTSDVGKSSPKLTRQASPVPDKRPASPEPSTKEPEKRATSPEPTLKPPSASAWKPTRRASPEPDEPPRRVSPAPEKTRKASPEPPKESRDASPEPDEEEEQKPIDRKVRDKENVGDAPPTRFAPATRRGPPALSFNPNVSPEMDNYRKPSDDELEEMKKKDPPLKNTWVIWEIRMKGKKESFDSGSVVASFGTVKGFWSYWNHLPQPSQLLEGKRFMRETGEGRTIVDCLMLFREGVKPEWEDPANATGGHFQIQLTPRLGGGPVDEYWNNIVFGMVTGAIEPADMITGARLVDKLAISNPARQHIRLEVWFSNFKDTKKVEALQANFEKCLCTKLDGTLSSEPPRVEIKKH